MTQQMLFLFFSCFFSFLLTEVQQRGGESVKRTLPPLHPPKAEKGQVDDGAICGLEAGHKNGLIVRTEALYYHGAPYKCK